MNSYTIHYARSDDAAPSSLDVQAGDDQIAVLACIRFLSVLNVPGAWANVSLRSGKECRGRMGKTGDISHFLETL